MLGFGLAAAALLAGCTSHPPPPLGPRDLGSPRSFRLFPIYWAGLRFEGIPLTQVDRGRDYNATLGMRVYYGSCLHSNPLVAGSCTLPLEINTTDYRTHANIGVGENVRTTTRGVPAVIYDHGDSIELYSGKVAIDVFADNPSRAFRAAQAMRPINWHGTSNDPLPRPQYRPELPTASVSAVRRRAGNAARCWPGARSPTAGAARPASMRPRRNTSPRRNS